METIIFKNFHLLDGTESMQDTLLKYLEVKNGVITRIGDFEPEENSLVYDLDEQYLLPGLINLNSHLSLSGDLYDKALEKKSKHSNNPIAKKIAVSIEKKNALVTLKSGVTTIRSAGGIDETDTILRDMIDSDKVLGPRILACNAAICSLNGYMDGVVAKVANSDDEAIGLVRALAIQNVNHVKLMVTDGIINSIELGDSTLVRMPSSMIKACCEEAHNLGLKVSAHAETIKGIQLALENGVDIIEHGGSLDENMIRFLKNRGGSLITTISPTLPFLILKDRNPYGVTAKNNARKVLEGMIKGAKACLSNGLDVGIGSDAGAFCTTHYNFWRELYYFQKLMEVTPEKTLYLATLGNARIAGIDNETGSIEIGKSADLIVIRDNPFKNKFKNLSNPALVMIKGKAILNPHIKKNSDVEKVFEKIM